MNVQSEENHIVIKKAEEQDFEILFGLVCKLAEYEKLPPPTNEAKMRLLEDGFGKNERYTAYLAYYNSKPVGYAVTFETYSSFLAKPTFYLEDIFVLEEFRGKKIGYTIFNSLLQYAKENGCGRFEFVVLDWNKHAINFYEKFGAENQKEWLYYRINLQ